MATTSKKTAKSGSTSSKKAAKAKKLQPVPAEGELPTAADVTFVTSGPLPGPMTHPPAGNLGYLFTDPVNTVLESASVSGFFGEPLAVGTLAADATAANGAAVARDHFEAGKEAAALLYNGPGQRLLARLTVIMERWGAFATAYPTEASQLASLRTAWVEGHPGRSKKKTGTSTTGAAPVAPVAPSAPAKAGS